MKLLVPTNFEKSLLSLIDKTQVVSIYGKLAADHVGGGRPSALLPRVDKKFFERYVVCVHQAGLEFDYLLNAACLGNREYTPRWQQQARALLDWLVKIKVDSVTVAVPYLAKLVKKNYPTLKINASVIAHIDSVIKAKYWQDLGADMIILQATALNRNFKELKRIRKHVQCRLGLIANDACLYKCPSSYYHYAMTSHASRAQEGCKGSRIDSCLLDCKKLRIEDLLHVIRASWIRPEDIRHYEDVGIDVLKLSGRNKNTDFIVKSVRAYSARSYEGNLADLLAIYNKYLAPSLKTSMSLKGPLQIYIDNRVLDGFLDFFLQGKCQEGLCDECGYCRAVAQRAVKIDKTYRARTLSCYKDFLDKFI